MTPSEILFKLTKLPPDTPITAEHIVAILSSLQSQQTVTSNPGAYSTWDKDKQINTETLAEWIGETPNRLKQWRFEGKGPKFVSKPKHVTYRVGDVRDWLNSRTVQSTTQADHLSFASGFADYYTRPTIYIDNEPMALFKSIELFDGETNITGFEVITAAKDSLAALYLSAIDNDDTDSLLDHLSNQVQMNELTTLFINGKQEQRNIAHMLASHPFTDGEHQRHALVELLQKGLDCNIADNNGKTAMDYADDFYRKTVNSFIFYQKMQSKLPEKT